MSFNRIQKHISRAEYADANALVQEYMKKLAEGKKEIENIKEYIKSYEQSLNELSSNLEAVSHESTENRLLRREEARGLANHSKNLLLRVKEIINEAEKKFKE